MDTRTLTSSPALLPALARGALLSPLRRPRSDAPVPATRLVLPGVRVDLARLAAYERVCGFATGSRALPPTYPHVLGFPLAMRIMAGRGFPLPLLGLVHTSIEITQWSPPPVTAEYELAVYVERLVPHRRGTEARVLTEARVDGGLVWESRSTYLARHRRRAGDTAPESATTDPSGAGSAGGAIGTGGTNEVGSTDGASGSEGPSLPSRAEWRLAGDVGRRYAAVSGDRNPIHLHPFTARLFGFPRAIAHGMWTVARCLAEYGPQGEVTVRADFRAPVLLPGTVTYAAEGPAFELRGKDRVHLTGEVRPALW
ncbi:MaoC/PaaZ C-terminal domain-containing protein [Streptomyces sp. NPDC005813]|uniref:MaoC/PaaZ C-terminal domain-containing protein n=1 Tax=Streptomyces sp. NPDC005813 TaxID=3155592 RepID=UPI0033FE9068